MAKKIEYKDNGNARYFRAVSVADVTVYNKRDADGKVVAPDRPTVAMTVVCDDGKRRTSHNHTVGGSLDITKRLFKELGASNLGPEHLRQIFMGDKPEVLARVAAIRVVEQPQTVTETDDNGLTTVSEAEPKIDLRLQDVAAANAGGAITL
jgi:hypothetical protein